MSPESITSALAQQALSVWQAGVRAVDSSLLVQNSICRSSDKLIICGEEFDLAFLDRLIVVGAGKAGAGMARGLEQALDLDTFAIPIESWINVPADCVVELQRVHLHAARPPGLNEPTEEGVEGSRRILNLVSSMSERDLCLVLISGGGSALLPLPVDGISLADKQSVTRFLSRNGASIQELNTVRKWLSKIKGGGLVRSARAGRMIALVISDVIGDPLDIIASGPTVCDSGTAADALAVLKRFAGSDRQTITSTDSAIPKTVWNELERQAVTRNVRQAPSISVRNQIIGNNQTALDAAAERARSLGFEVRILGSNRQGFAKDVGGELAELCLSARSEKRSQPICWLGGGEPVVQLAATERPRLGGRNQELALAALCWLWNEDLTGITILSGGTDGEDGPTDAAGAICCHEVRDRAKQTGLDPFDSLSISDSYTFFNQAGGLIRTGPTHTNVMDLQVAVLDDSHLPKEMQ